MDDEDIPCARGLARYESVVEGTRLRAGRNWLAGGFRSGYCVGRFLYFHLFPDRFSRLA